MSEPIPDEMASHRNAAMKYGSNVAMDIHQGVFSMTHQTGRQFNRRYLLKSAGQTAAAMALASFLPGRAIAGDATDIPITGKAVPSLSGFDDLLQTLLKEHKIPGASLAIARHG